MLIVIDWNQICLQALFSAKLITTNESSPTTIDEDLVRHIIFDMLRSYVQKFKKPPASDCRLVLACDGKNSWRKDVFEHYKANRAKSRAKSPHDWSVIYKIINQIRDEIVSIGLFDAIHIDRVEADDIIAVLAKKAHENDEKTIIVSTDKDFLQLQAYHNIAQWSPTKGTYIKEKSPTNYLIEHVIRGDIGDGIPNIFADDDVFVVDNKRSPPVTKKRLQEWFDFIHEGKTDSIDTKIINKQTKAAFKRNKKLIDLVNNEIPHNLVDQILNADNTSKHRPRNSVKAKFLDFLIHHRMQRHIESIDEFFFS